MLAFEDLEIGKIYRCKKRRGLLEFTFYQKRTVWTTSHKAEINPETPFVFLESFNKKYLKVLTSDGMIGYILFHSPYESINDMEKVTHQ